MRAACWVLCAPVRWRWRAGGQASRRRDPRGRGLALGVGWGAAGRGDGRQGLRAGPAAPQRRAGWPRAARPRPRGGGEGARRPLVYRTECTAPATAAKGRGAGGAAGAASPRPRRSARSPDPKHPRRPLRAPGAGTPGCPAPPRQQRTRRKGRALRRERVWGPRSVSPKAGAERGRGRDPGGAAALRTPFSPATPPPLAHAGGGRGPAPAAPRAASPPARPAAFSFVSRSPERLLSRREGAGGGSLTAPWRRKSGKPAPHAPCSHRLRLRAAEAAAGLATNCSSGARFSRGPVGSGSPCEDKGCDWGP